MNKPVVFVDTSYLSHMPSDEVADWNKILRLSKSSELEIRISEIAANEYRTKSRDDLDSAISRVESALTHLKRKWSASPFAHELGDTIGPDAFPSPEDTERASYVVIDELKAAGVNITKPANDHSERSWRKYFSWTGVFGKTQLSERDNPENRNGRRKHIPDAWIYEAAVDLIRDNRRAVCLCKDGRLSDALAEAGLDVLARGVEVIGLLESSEKEGSRQIVTEGEGDQVLSDTANLPGSSDLHGRLAQIELENKTIQVRILGYAHWFDPLPRTKLIDLLQRYGHKRAEAENALDRLGLESLIRDVGGQVIPEDKALSNLAAEEVMPEILEILDQES